MAINQLLSILVICSCGYATLSAAQSVPTAFAQAAKDVLSFPLDTITAYLFEENLSAMKFKPTNGALVTHQLNATKRTLIHCHGYLQSTDDPFVTDLLRGYVTGYDYNVLAIDYRFITYNFYPTSVLLAGAVSGVVGYFVETLVRAGLKEEDLILSGFSLGAQIMGNVARRLPFKVHELLALDPAGPLFNFVGTSVSASDALCVKCVHTDEYYYGTFKPCGHLDFYPNGGSRNQPGCTFLSSVSACSHERATEFTAEAALDPHGFPSIQCDSWADFKIGKCNKSAVIPFGQNAPCSASGKYYLQTNKHKPYARGMAGITYDPSLESPFFL
ncbi:lipase member H [Megalopta genalis]|uniref:lipase member H n=1 Tax=Megalopta genalis TaxID=115081 RepID=UPI003FD554BE